MLIYEEILDNKIEVLAHSDTHRYLGKHVSSDNERSDRAIEINIGNAWKAYHAHKYIFGNTLVNRYLRVKLLDAICFPIICFDIVSNSISDRMRSRIRDTQRKS